MKPTPQQSEAVMLHTQPKRRLRLSGSWPISLHYCWSDRLRDLVVRVPGYRSRGPGFDSQRYQIFLVVCLERDPLSLVRIIEELLERKVAAPV
jgi:hypothetical protein